MEIILYIYFGVNLMVLGSYLLDSFNDDRIIDKVKCSSVLFFFGVILIVYEFWLADKVEYILQNTELGFWYKLSIKKQWDNLDKRQIKYIKNQILTEKEDKNSKLVKHLKRILKRNEKSNIR